MGGAPASTFTAHQCLHVHQRIRVLLLSLSGSSLQSPAWILSISSSQLPDVFAIYLLPSAKGSYWISSLGPSAIWPSFLYPCSLSNQCTQLTPSYDVPRMPLKELASFHLPSFRQIDTGCLKILMAVHSHNAPLYRAP